jgi:4-hydroxy-4-methyl-2-oxoglutarate aldolase
VELTERLARLSASQVSDGLGAAGLPRDGLLGVFPIEPARHIAGRAFTVYFRPAAEAADRKIEYIAGVSPGEVIVLGNHGRLDCSVWGGQRTVGALQRGAVATVIDGAYRDVDEHRALGYPVFGRAPTVTGSSGYTVPVATGETLTISGILIRPGDYIVGDASGVVVIPQDRAEDVTAHAERITAEEQRIAAAVAAGADFTTFRADTRTAR